MGDRSLSSLSATESRKASYADPIVVCAGEELILTGRDDNWKGHRWLWAIAPDGRQGWIPDGLVVTEGCRTRAGFDYSAVELSCSRGETLIAGDTINGWVWCTNSRGISGWVPADILQPVADTA